ncbi:MAG: SUMF1/EgtB/PvdO family nonheme iron enzyme [Planctomycetes bacterium]|nr:SUMF1/EgtB/PvdO family nonheme iron enzyme [Planctomycetota bacterium]
MAAIQEISFGLLALDRGKCSRGQLVQAFVDWLNERDRARLVPETRVAGLAAHLARVAELPDATRHELEAIVSTGDSCPPIDAVTRATLIGLHPPREIADWLLAYEGGAGPETSFEPAPPGKRYELGSEIARGGLGRVLEARDRDLDRDIAVKVLLEGASREVVERFVREARITARLDHPNIVPVHDFGVTAGGRRLFLCMKRVQGRDLASILRAMAGGDREVERGWSRARLLGVFQGVCQGMAYAHSQGVIHRDLKPANVMIGDYGETYVVDWGLAKRLGEEEPTRGGGPRSPRGWEGGDTTSLTLVGQVIGTPAYMSPEQAEGDLDAVDTLSDLYSLGAILYAILTWHTPFKAGGSRSVLALVKAGEFRPPSEAVAALRAQGAPAPDPVPPGLEAICLKAMARSKKDRYASASDLHDELQQFLEGVKDREKRTREAIERAAEGRGELERYRALVKEETETAPRLQDRLLRYDVAEEEKKVSWTMEARLEAIEEERVDVWARASLAFGRALAADPDCPEALDGRCELILERLYEAERKRNRQEEMIQRHALAQADRDGRHVRRLEEPGRLTVRTLAFDCSCLAPVATPGWNVEFDLERLVPFRAGRPRPDAALQDSDMPVPVIRTRGGRWGHGQGCVRRDVRGVEVLLAKYEEVGRRLVPVRESSAGVTPIENLVLPPGSWRVLLRPPAESGLAPVAVPVDMARGGSRIEEVTLYANGHIPPGFAQVPGGPFIYGGEHAGGNRERLETTEDLFVSRFATTAGEYILFLNDLCAGGRSEEAAARQPRDSSGPLWISEGAGAGTRFSLPEPPVPSWGRAWEPSWPVFCVSWADALAYAAWRSRRDGRIYRLAHECEYEKFTRGVDARIFPFGNRFDRSFAHTGISESGIASPRPVGHYPIDESPYGVRDTAGCITAWCQCAGYGPFRRSRAIRGGSWSFGWQRCRVATRGGTGNGSVSNTIGFRLVASPVEG